jgi:hypothetical protein
MILFAGLKVSEGLNLNPSGTFAVKRNCALGSDRFKVVDEKAVR